MSISPLFLVFFLIAIPTFIFFAQISQANDPQDWGPSSQQEVGRRYNEVQSFLDPQQ